MFEAFCLQCDHGVGRAYSMDALQALKAQHTHLVGHPEIDIDLRAIPGGGVRLVCDHCHVILSTGMAPVGTLIHQHAAQRHQGQIGALIYEPIPTPHLPVAPVYHCACGWQTPPKPTGAFLFQDLEDWLCQMHLHVQRSTTHVLWPGPRPRANPFGPSASTGSTSPAGTTGPRGPAGQAGVAGSNRAYRSPAPPAPTPVDLPLSADVKLDEVL